MFTINRFRPGLPSRFEALVYDMPLGLFFHKAVLCYRGELHTFSNFWQDVRDPRELAWTLRGSTGSGVKLEVDIRGREGFVHRLPYLKTDCSGQFQVANDCLAQARMVLQLPDGTTEELATDVGAVLEMAGNRTV
jgi:hypothetical protein